MAAAAAMLGSSQGLLLAADGDGMPSGAAWAVVHSVTDDEIAAADAVADFGPVGIDPSSPRGTCYHHHAFDGSPLTNDASSVPCLRLLGIVPQCMPGYYSKIAHATL